MTNRFHLTMLLPLLGSLLLLASGAWAYQEVSKSSNIDLIQNLIANVHMNTDIGLSARMRLANDTTGAGPAVIYFPRNITDDQDLDASQTGPNGTGVYMCPGQLRVLINQSSTFANGRFGATANYGVPPPPDVNRQCPNILLNQCGNQCNMPCGWGQDNGGLVQWINDPAFVTRMRGSVNRIVNQQTQPADYNFICTDLQSKSDYYTILEVPPPPPQYPGQNAQSGLICSGSEWVTLDSNPMTRPADGAVSPGPIVSPGCNPTTGDAWVTGNMALGTHSIQSLMGSQQCLGFIHIWPDVANSAQNWKNIYRDNTNGVPLVALNTTAASWNVIVVDPQTCSVSATVDPSTIVPTDGASYLLNVTISNPDSVFDMVADGVGIASAPEPGWNATQGPAPNGFAPDIIPAQGNATLVVNLTAPDPLTVHVGCVDISISLHSAQPMCNLQPCLTNVTVQVCFNNADDLAALVIPNATSVPVTKPPTSFNVDVYTWNSGTRPTPLGTNTSVVLDGSPARYYPVPMGVIPGALDANGLPQPPQSYVKRTYPAVCEFPHLAVFTMDADFGNHLTEIDEVNNHAVGIVQCGTSLGCYDYI